MRAGSIARMLRDRVTFTPSLGVDAYGQRLEGDGTLVSARVVHEHKRSRDPAGEEFLSTTQILTLHPAQVGDVVTVDGRTRAVRSVKRAGSLRGGATLTEVML